MSQREREGGGVGGGGGGGVREARQLLSKEVKRTTEPIQRYFKPESAVN